MAEPTLPVRLSSYDYDLPKALIAQQPAPIRDASRLLVIRPDSLEHRHFSDLSEYLRAGDCLVLNETKVLNAKVRAKKATGGMLELLLVRRIDGSRFECLVRGKAATGAQFHTQKSGLRGSIAKRLEGGSWECEFDIEPADWQRIYDEGEMPLPQYIHELPKDPSRYQTVYAKDPGSPRSVFPRQTLRVLRLGNPGSVAAPTAGLHFTNEMLDRIAAAGVKIARISLDIGVGTFEPVRVEDVSRHRMKSEEFSIDDEAARTINETLDSGNRLISVGTTTVRSLESSAKDGRVVAGSGSTDLFIYPGYVPKLRYSGMLTNFHLPKSTLLLMVCALWGRERVLLAYEEAIRERYRFYSFGDACLFLR